MERNKTAPQDMILVGIYPMAPTLSDTTDLQLMANTDMFLPHFLVI